jgi:hypothetical protein
MPPSKNETAWQPQGPVKGYIQTPGLAFVVDQSGNFIVDQSKNFIVTTPSLVVPLNATTWTETPAK